MQKKRAVKTRARTAPRKQQKKTSGGYEIAGILLFFLGLFVLVSLYVGSTGFLGDVVDKGTHFLFGFFAPLCALFMMFFGGRYAVTGRGISLTRRMVLGLLLAALLLAFIHHIFVPEGEEMDIASMLHYGGIVGACITRGLHNALGGLGTTLCLICLIVVDVLLLTHWSFSAGAQKVGGKAQEMGRKTGRKMENVAERLREKKAAMDAARSAARLEPIDGDHDDFVYQKPEETLPVETPAEDEQDMPPLPPLPEEEPGTPASMTGETPLPPAEEETVPVSDPAREMKQDDISGGGGEDLQPEEMTDPEGSTSEVPLASADADHLSSAGEGTLPAENPEPQDAEEPKEEPGKPDISHSGGLTDEEATDTEIQAAEESSETAAAASESGSHGIPAAVPPVEPGIKNLKPSNPVTSAASPQGPAVSIATPVYHFPPLSLLHSGGQATGQTDVAKKAALIETTLNSFGVHAKVVHSSVGPTVTRFELKPEMGVRVSKIEGLSNELAMALEATSIRIEAPIPGKSAVGIEIPNTKAAPVPLRDVLESPEFQKGKGHILVALGKGITGKPVVTDISKAPHLLIAGSTGSGKSVCINSIITSIIYKYRPDEVKLMLIDPKVVELSVYNGIPHLRTEVVTDMKKAQGTLNWAVREMEARYQLFAGAKVRNIEGYNEANPGKKMPYILIIVDEFADLMNVAAKEVEVLIQRLTQKARAAGIHLILATQRPSADVITGVIKSNIPSRISFMVESGLNSRIILDEGGAEKLLGKGDMLFKQAGSLHTVRVQGAFISDEEVENVVNYVKAECMKLEKQPVTYEPIDLSVPDDKKDDAPDEEEVDELLPEAAEWVLDTKRASVSALQRRFRIGYTRAGRLMDTMERMGVVGPAEGAKPREIRMTKEQLAEMLNESEKAEGT